MVQNENHYTEPQQAPNETAQQPQQTYEAQAQPQQPQQTYEAQAQPQQPQQQWVQQPQQQWVQQPQQQWVQQPQQPPYGMNGQYYGQYNAPMYDRSANGQYNMQNNMQYNMPPAYYPPQPIPPVQPQQPPKPPVDDRPGSLFFDKENYKEKLKVCRLGNSIGMSLSMFNFAGAIIQLVIIAVMYFVLGVESTEWQLNDTGTLYLINAVMTLFVLTLPYIYAAKFCGSKVTELVPFNKTQLTKVITLVMLGMGVCALSNFASSSITSIIEQFFGIVSESSSDGYGTGLKSFLLMLLCVGILPAILEEFALRGVVMGLLRKKFGDGAAIVISALLFGLLHGNIQQIPFAFGVGLILGYATVYSGSLVPAMIIHAMNNSISVVLTFATASVSPMISQVIMLLYYAVSLLVGLCGFIMLVKTDKTALRLSKDRTENTKRNTKWFFGSAWIIIFIIICALNVLLSLGLQVFI